MPSQKAHLDAKKSPLNAKRLTKSIKTQLKNAIKMSDYTRTGIKNMVTF